MQFTVLHVTVLPDLKKINRKHLPLLCFHLSSFRNILLGFQNMIKYGRIRISFYVSQQMFNSSRRRAAEKGDRAE